MESRHDWEPTHLPLLELLPAALLLPSLHSRAQTESCCQVRAEHPSSGRTGRLGRLRSGLGRRSHFGREIRVLQTETSDSIELLCLSRPDLSFAVHHSFDLEVGVELLVGEVVLRVSGDAPPRVEGRGGLNGFDGGVPRDSYEGRCGRDGRRGHLSGRGFRGFLRGRARRGEKLLESAALGTGHGDREREGRRSRV